MCEVIDKYINIGIEQGLERGIEQGIERGIEQGLERGIEQGIAQGIEQGLAQAVKALMDNMNLSLGQAMTALKIPSELQEKLKLLI